MKQLTKLREEYLSLGTYDKRLFILKQLRTPATGMPTGLSSRYFYLVYGLTRKALQSLREMVNRQMLAEDESELDGADEETKKLFAKLQHDLVRIRRTIPPANAISEDRKDIIVEVMRQYTRHSPEDHAKGKLAVICADPEVNGWRVFCSPLLPLSLPTLPLLPPCSSPSPLSLCA